MSNYVNWATGVNQHIVDSTTFTIGDGGRADNANEYNTFKESYLTSLAVPDKFSVTMDFDWSEKDANGLSEFDRFINWYKYVHCRGTIPFMFPNLTKFGTNGGNEMSYYKITANSINCSKFGLSYRVTMEWTEFVNKAISIPDIIPTVSGIYALPDDKSRIIYVSYSGTVSRIPSLTNYNFKIDNVQETPQKVIPSYSITNYYAFDFGGTWSSGVHDIEIIYMDNLGQTQTKVFNFRV